MGWIIIALMMLLGLIIGFVGIGYILFRVIPISFKLHRIKMKKAEQYIKDYEEQEKRAAAAKTQENKAKSFDDNPDWEWDNQTKLWRYKKR